MYLYHGVTIAVMPGVQEEKGNHSRFAPVGRSGNFISQDLLLPVVLVTLSLKICSCRSFW